jgi:hypothetical protein
MADIVSKDYPDIRLNQLSKMTNIECAYYRKEDTLYIRSGAPRPAVSLDLDGEIWLRFDPDTGDIVGLEIDDFESIFLKKHPEISKAWQQAKPHCLAKPPKRVGPDKDSFLLIILSFLSSFLDAHPPQARLAPC